MRRVNAVVLAIACSASPACTFMAEFVDAPAGGCEAGDCAGPTEDASVDATIAHDASDGSLARDAADVFDAGPPDVSLLCKGHSGWFCGYNGLNGTAPSKDDLVECRDGSVKTLILCDAGCLAYPTPVPDRCNECPSKKDGTFCGNEFPSALPLTETVVVRCTQGLAIVDRVCANGCIDDAGGKATCK